MIIGSRTLFFLSAPLIDHAVQGKSPCGTNSALNRVDFQHCEQTRVSAPTQECPRQIGGVLPAAPGRNFIVGAMLASPRVVCRGKACLTLAIQIRAGQAPPLRLNAPSALGCQEETFSQSPPLTGGAGEGEKSNHPLLSSPVKGEEKWRDVSYPNQKGVALKSLGGIREQSALG